MINKVNKVNKVKRAIRVANSLTKGHAFPLVVTHANQEAYKRLLIQEGGEALLHTGGIDSDWGPRFVFPGGGEVMMVLEF